MKLLTPLFSMALSLVPRARNSWHFFGMTIFLSLLIVGVPSNGRAQSPLLRTMEIPDSATLPFRADGMLNSTWDQSYPYNQLCPRDPMNGNSYAGLYFARFRHLRCGPGVRGLSTLWFYQLPVVPRSRFGDVCHLDFQFANRLSCPFGR